MGKRTWLTNLAENGQVRLLNVQLDSLFKEVERAGKIKVEPGFSPTISVSEIAGGHRVVITDMEGEKSFDVMDGQGEGSGVYFETDATLSLENGVLSVNTADAPERDNTLPITSAAVFESVGNINALLETI